MPTQPEARISAHRPGTGFQVIQPSARPRLRMLTTALPSDLSSEP